MFQHLVDSLGNNSSGREVLIIEIFVPETFRRLSFTHAGARMIQVHTASYCIKSYSDCAARYRKSCRNFRWTTHPASRSSST